MVEVTIPIRWRDVDAYGHVNNAVYLNYLEEARDRWALETLGPEVDFVIVRIAIDYRRELSQDDEAVTVSCRGGGYGTSSIRTAERVVAKGGGGAGGAGGGVGAPHAPGRSSRAPPPPGGAAPGRGGAA